MAVDFVNIGDVKYAVDNGYEFTATMDKELYFAGDDFVFGNSVEHVDA